MVLKNASATIPISSPQLTCFKTTHQIFWISHICTTTQTPFLLSEQDWICSFLQGSSTLLSYQEKGCWTDTKHLLVFITPIRNINCCSSIPRCWQLVKNNHFLPPLTTLYTTARPFAHGSATSPKYFADSISWKTITLMWKASLIDSKFEFRLVSSGFR